MKKFFSLAFFSIVLPFYGQLVDVVPAKDCGLKDYLNVSGMFNLNNGGLYSLETETGKPAKLEKYSEDFSKIYTVTWEKSNAEEAEQTEAVQNKIYYFTTKYDGHNKELILRVVDDATGKLSTDKMVIASLESDPFGTNGRTFGISFSPDGTKLLIMSEFQWPKKPQNVTGEIFELPSLKSISTFTTANNENGVNIKTSDYTLTNDSKVIYYYITEPKEKKEIKKRALVCYDTKTKTTLNKEIPWENKVLESSKAFIKNNVYYRVGILKDDFSKKEHQVNKGGVFSITFDVNNFDKAEFLLTYYSDVILEKIDYTDPGGDRGILNKKISCLGVKETPTGFYLIENLAYTLIVSSSNASSSRQVSREFIITKFNYSGKPEFTKLIPKNGQRKMYGTDIMLCNEDLYLFYCEHPKNLENYTLESFEPYKYRDVFNLTGPVPVCVKISSKGDVTRQILERNEEWCYYPGMGVSLKNGCMLIGMRVKEDKYILEGMRIKK